MKKYKVEITERIVSHISLEAENPSDAERKAENIYEHNVGLVQLDAEASGFTCETVGEVDVAERKKEEPIVPVGNAGLSEGVEQ